MAEIALALPVWKRHWLTLPILRWIRDSNDDVGVALVVALSEAEWTPSYLALHRERFDVCVLEMPNQPLGAKHNVVYESAFAHSNLVALVESEDLVRPGLLRELVDFMRAPGAPGYVGFDGMFMTDVRAIFEGERRAGAVGYWGGYDPDGPRAGEPVGSMRVLHRKRYRPQPYEAQLRKGLDGSFRKTIGLPDLLLDGRDAGLCTIKTEESISPLGCFAFESVQAWPAWRDEHAPGFTMPDPQPLAAPVLRGPS